MFPELQAILLVGGLGTRLQSELGDLPKPMVVVGGHPFLELIMLHLRSFGIGVVVLAVSHRHESIEEYFGNGASLGISVAYSREPQPLGTAGALRNALSLVQGDQVLVLNGDSFVDADYHEMLRHHRVHRNQLTIAAVQQSDCRDSGRLLISNNDVVAFLEKDTFDRSAGYINAGVYVFERRVIETIQPGVVQSLEKEVFPSLLSRGGRIGAYCTERYFADLGTPERLRQVRADFLDGRIPFRGVAPVSEDSHG